MKKITIASSLILFVFISGNVSAQENVESSNMESGLSEAVKNDRSILSAALDNVGLNVLGGSGAESSEAEGDSARSRGVKSNIDPLVAVKQIENAYEYSSWNGRNPFSATGSLAFELGIGLENMLPKELDDASAQNKVVEVVNVTVQNDRQPEPLEFFDTGSLVFKGQFTNIFGQPVAIISGPDNALYKATVGDRIGLSQAKVVQINDTEVVLVTGSIVNRIPLSVAADF